MSSPALSDLVMKELDFLQSNITRYDTVSLRIKTWSIATWSALCAYSVTENQNWIVLAAIFAVLCFSFLELTYRAYQLRFITRMAFVERAINTGLVGYNFALDEAARTPLKGARSGRHVQSPTMKEYVHSARPMHVSALYVFQLAASVALFAFMHCR